MPAPTPDTVSLLVRRADLLSELRDAPPGKPALVDDLPYSRSTVDRAVRSLEDAGLVERNGGVALTLRGRLALDAFDRFAGNVDAIEAAVPVVEPLPRTARIDNALFRGADVVSATREAPQRPSTAFLDAAEEMTAYRGYASAVIPAGVEVVCDRVVEHGATADVVMPESALDELLSSHADTVEPALETGRLTLREADAGLEYSLLLVDQPDRTLACALAYGDGGLNGLVKNDRPHAVRWVESVYEDLRADAEPLPA
ncbi:MAG: helix-turn-helix transcriptional regulator [Halobacterium sp.]